MSTGEPALFGFPIAHPQSVAFPSRGPAALLAAYQWHATLILKSYGQFSPVHRLYCTNKRFCGTDYPSLRSFRKATSVPGLERGFVSPHHREPVANSIHLCRPDGLSIPDPGGRFQDERRLQARRSLRRVPSFCRTRQARACLLKRFIKVLLLVPAQQDRQPGFPHSLHQLLFLPR